MFGLHLGTEAAKFSHKFCSELSADAPCRVHRLYSGSFRTGSYSGCKRWWTRWQFLHIWLSLQLGCGEFITFLSHCSCQLKTPEYRRWTLMVSEQIWENFGFCWCVRNFGQNVQLPGGLSVQILGTMEPLMAVQNMISWWSGPRWLSQVMRSAPWAGRGFKLELIQLVLPHLPLPFIWLIDTSGKS